MRGGGKKPYSQKGTGNARQGSSRSPQFVGGGQVFGPHPRDYEYTVPKKVRRAALASALSLRAKEQKLVIVVRAGHRRPQDQEGDRRAEGPGDIVRPGRRSARTTPTLTKSVRNLPETKCLAPEGLNVYDILNYPTLVITRDAVKAVESRILGSAEKPEPGTAAGRRKISKAATSDDGLRSGLKGQACALPN